MEVFSMFSEGPWGRVRFPALSTGELTVSDRVLDEAELAADGSGVWVWGGLGWWGLRVFKKGDLFEEVLVLCDLLLPSWYEPREVREGESKILVKCI